MIKEETHELRMVFEERRQHLDSRLETIDPDAFGGASLALELSDELLELERGGLSSFIYQELRALADGEVPVFVSALVSAALLGEDECSKKLVRDLFFGDESSQELIERVLEELEAPAALPLFKEALTEAETNGFSSSGGRIVELFMEKFGSDPEVDAEVILEAFSSYCDYTPEFFSDRNLEQRATIFSAAVAASLRSNGGTMRLERELLTLSTRDGDYLLAYIMDEVAPGHFGEHLAELVSHSSEELYWVGSKLGTRSLLSQAMEDLRWARRKPELRLAAMEYIKQVGGETERKLIEQSRNWTNGTVPEALALAGGIAASYIGALQFQEYGVLSALGMFTGIVASCFKYTGMSTNRQMSSWGLRDRNSEVRKLAWEFCNKVEPTGLMKRLQSLEL